MVARPALPLIVCGFPRSGTLTCAQALGLSPQVELQGEMGAPDETLAYLETLKAWHQARGPRGAPWFDKAYEVYFDTIAGASPARRVTKPDTLYRGHKTPRHERYFDRYEALFDRPERRPRYVYCLREPWSVWRSLKAMPWNSFDDVGAFIQAWSRSVETYERMVETAPDRVLLFRLDAFVAAADRAAYVNEALLGPLGIDPDRLTRPVSELANKNATARKTGEAPAPLFQDEIDRIGADRRSRPWMERYFADVTPPSGPKRGWLEKMRT